MSLLCTVTYELTKSIYIVYHCVGTKCIISHLRGLFDHYVYIYTILVCNRRATRIGLRIYTLHAHPPIECFNYVNAVAAAAAAAAVPPPGILIKQSLLCVLWMTRICCRSPHQMYHI